jgi:multiple sugar transport system permease protein
VQRLRRKTISSDNEIGAALLFILPSLLGFIIFFLFPVLFSLVLSFSKWDMSSGFSNIKFVGIENFVDIFTEVWFTDSMKNSLVFTVSTVIIGTSLSLVLAVVLNRLVYFKNSFKVLFFMPYISSAVAIAIVWMVVLQPSYGPVNQFLRSVGMQNPPNWLADVHWALPALIAMYVWQNLGYNMVVYMAGLSAISGDLYEAAEIDGANGFKKFTTITIPMVSPTTFFLVIMGIINSFKVFDQVQVLTQGGPGTSTTMLALYIYREAFQFYKMGYASAAAWAMFLIIFIVTVIQWRGQKKWVTYE